MKYPLVLYREIVKGSSSQNINNHGNPPSIDIDSA